MIERFTPDVRAARTENVVAAIGVGAGVPALLWLSRGERDPVLLAVVGVVGAVLTYALYSWRYHRDGMRWLEIGPDALRIGRRADVTELPWSEVSRARRSLYGGEQWVLTTTGGRHVVLRLDGFPPAVAARIGAHLRESLGDRVR
ncbi:MAG TPA: hypothetical protein VFS08_18585 [Gemmatimonadaceae bacterium]|nr:hypothetical protein [Gemmatimonadaceae bacterium]